MRISRTLVGKFQHEHRADRHKFILWRPAIPPPLSKGCPLCPPPLGDLCPPSPEYWDLPHGGIRPPPPPYFFHNTNLRAKYTSYSTFWRLMYNFPHLLRITPQSPPPPTSICPQCKNLYGHRSKNVLIFFHNSNFRAKYTSYSTFWRLMCNFLHLLRITPQSPPPLLSAPQCILAPSGGSKECGQKFKSVPNSPKWQKICIKIAS